MRKAFESGSEMRKLWKSFLVGAMVVLLCLSLFYLDFDLDGLPNLEEIRHGYNPLSADSDQDGHSDYVEAYGYELTIFQDEEFRNTGWKPKYKEIKLPEGEWAKVEMEFVAFSDNDPLDRLYSVFIEIPGQEEIELHRGVTPLRQAPPNSIKSKEDITSYIPILRGSKKFGVILTVFELDPWNLLIPPQNRTWRITVKLRFYPGKPEEVPSAIIPVFCLEEFTNFSMSKNISLPIEGGIAKRVVFDLRATGHYMEEDRTRDVVIMLDGEVYFEVRVGGLFRKGGGWERGQGTIPWIKLESAFNKIEAGSHELTVQVPKSGFYWVISLNLLLGS